jgi:hypothetical protein
MTHTQKLLTLTSLMLLNTATYAAPSNEELFQMILALKKEVANAKYKEIELQTNLEQTKNELIATKKQLNEAPKADLSLANKSSSETPKINKPDAKEGFTVSAGTLFMTNDDLYFGGDMKNSSDYDPGFQIASTYQTKNNWDYALKFKNFTTIANGNIDYGNGDAYALKSKLQLNIIDLEVGKLFSFSDTIELRIAGGVRSIIGKYSYTYTYSSAFALPITGTSGTSKTNYWGVGPRITGTPIWKPFANDFRIFGNFGASFLMGSSGSNYQDSARNLILEAGSGIGYILKTNPYNIDLQTGYQLESWGTNNSNFTGYHGPYANIGVKF